MTDLLACPFCGDDGEKGQQTVTMMNEEHTQFDRITCRCCGAMAPELNWQKRATATASEATAAQQDGWMPIETAHTDRNGPALLGYGETAGEISGPSGVMCIEVMRYSGPCGDYPGYDWVIAGDAYANWIRPTHWQPMPPPPANHGIEPEQGEVK